MLTSAMHWSNPKVSLANLFKFKNFLKKTFGKLISEIMHCAP